MIDSKIPASSVIAQMEMDAIGLNSRRDDDDLVTTGNVNRWGTSPKDVRDCNAQRGPSLAENVGILICLHASSTRNCCIQHPSALMSGNISKSLSSISDPTSNSPCTLLPLTYRKAYSHSLIQHPLHCRGPPLNHLRLSWIKPLLVRRFFQVDRNG